MAEVSAQAQVQGGVRVHLEQPRPTMDLATLVGLICGFGLITAAIVMGGTPGSFINLPSVLIVVGGTLAVTTVCFSLAEMARTGRAVMQTLVHTHHDPAEAATEVLKIAETARRHGILSLQNHLSSIRNQPFLYKGISLIVDGTSGEEVEAIMRRDIHATAQRHAASTSVLRKMAEFSPAMGLIGTLIGLVQMLSHLEDPSTIGPSMAVALLTTFYGAVLANMVFSPLASKLERNSAEESLINNIYLMGASSVGRQENPRRLEMLLNSVLPPSKRVQYFD